MTSTAGPEPNHVGFLVHGLDVGGIERSVITIAAAWPVPSKCSIISARGGHWEPFAREAAATSVLAEGWPSVRAIVRFVYALRTKAKRESLDAVLTNSFGMSRVVLLLKKLGGLKSVAVLVVEHSTLSAKVAGLFRSRLLCSIVLMLTRWLYRSADGLVGVSQGVSRDLEATLRLPAGSVTTIYNPVDTSRIASAIHDKVPKDLEAAFSKLPRPIVITVGRLVAAKAQNDLLAGFAMLPESERGTLVILGDGPLRAKLQNEAIVLGIADRVWMPGFVDNPWWFLARSDVFVLSSHWEGFSLGVLEALACGIPVVSTDCPSGPREVLAASSLTPVGQPAELSQAIVRAFTEPRPQQGAALSRFEPSGVATRYVNTIRGVLAGGPIQV